MMRIMTMVLRMGRMTMQMMLRKMLLWTWNE